MKIFIIYIFTYFIMKINISILTIISALQSSLSYPYGRTKTKRSYHITILRRSHVVVCFHDLNGTMRLVTRPNHKYAVGEGGSSVSFVIMCDSCVANSFSILYLERMS